MAPLDKSFVKKSKASERAHSTNCRVSLHFRISFLGYPKRFHAQAVLFISVLYPYRHVWITCIARALPKAVTLFLWQYFKLNRVRDFLSFFPAFSAAALAATPKDGTGPVAGA